MAGPKKPSSGKVTKQEKEGSSTEAEETVPDTEGKPPAAAEAEVPATESGAVQATPPLSQEQLNRLRRKLKAKYH